MSCLIRLFAVNGSTQYLYGPDGTRTATMQGGAVTAEYLYGMDGTLATTVDATGKLVRGALYGGGMHLADYTAGTGAGGGKTEFHLSDAVDSLVNTIDQTRAALESCAAGAAATGAVNLMRAGNFTSSTREGAIKDNAENNGGANKCEKCGGDVQRVGNQKGQSPPGDQLQVHHDPAIKDGGGRNSKPVVVCRDCHVDIYNP